MINRIILACLVAVLFFCAAVGVTIIPQATAWGLFFVALGLALSGVASFQRIVTVGK